MSDRCPVLDLDSVRQCERQVGHYGFHVATDTEQFTYLHRWFTARPSGEAASMLAVSVQEDAPVQYRPMPEIGEF